jgi:rod shape-determining protein MreB
MLLQLFQKLLSGGPYYVRMRPQLLSVRDVSTKKAIEDVPLMAISKGRHQKVLAIGATAAADASTSGAEFNLINGFTHPRSIISDFTVAEKTLQHYFRLLSGNNILKPSPVVVMHPLEKTEGGLTQIEIRALLELARGAGAREAYIWTGRELMDNEFERKQFPGDHWLPERPTWANN